MVYVMLLSGPMMLLCPGVTWATDESNRAAEWMEREYHYLIVEQDVQDVLKEFGRNLALPMEVSPRVEGDVRGDIRAETARGFLEQVCAANDLAWFFDGGVLHVAKREEMTHQSFELTDIDSQRLMADIEGSSVGDPMRSRLVDGGETLQIWGMNAWVDDVARRVERLRQPAPSNGGGVTVFRGSITTQTAE
ncbi:hypothetical protein EI168_01450 [Halomonas sp. FME1]|uniref:Type III secretion protein C n=1 Tax=Halomonas casei TaxID=2742613 RepID=A0ABR9EX32_9GAMM|nr:hypothetical protein [Halomonas casei]MBE0398775.1 hypothetical protein [Halomonas casei]